MAKDWAKYTDTVLNKSDSIVLLHAKRTMLQNEQQFFVNFSTLI